MTGKQAEHLARMANQIAVNLGAGRSIDETARLTGEHLHKFWTRDMRRQLAGYARVQGDNLTPAVLRAIDDEPETGDAQDE